MSDVLIAAPVTDPLSPGAAVRWCSICAAEVQVSPEGLARLDAEHGLRPICLECAVPMMAAEDEVHVSPVDPTATEANRVVGDAMRRVVRRARAERKS